MISPKPLTLREYESAKIGDTWDPVNRVVPGYFVAAIERLQTEQRKSIFDISRHAIQAQQFVGTVGLDGLVVDIVPKIDGDDSSARAKLVTMLAIAGLMPKIDSGIAMLLPEGTTLLDCYMSVYVQRLAIEWRKGHILDYQRIEGNRTCLKGKLLFPAHVRRNLLHPERFYVRCDEFTENVEISRLLKAGIHVCRRQSVRSDTQRKALELLADFEGVQDTCFNCQDLDQITVDRKTQRFGPLVELARMFLTGQVPDRPGQGQTYSLVFDMNVVFERYIGQLLTTIVCPTKRSARLKLSNRHLLLQGKKPSFNLQPDVGIFEKKKLVCLLDTKWKILDMSKPHANVSERDVYQMYAYAKEYHCPSVILLYPQCEGLPQLVATYQHFPGDETSSRLNVFTVDIRKPPHGYGEDSVCCQLRKVLANAVSRVNNETLSDRWE